MHTTEDREHYGRAPAGETFPVPMFRGAVRQILEGRAPELEDAIVEAFKEAHAAHLAWTSKPEPEEEVNDAS